MGKPIVKVTTMIVEAAFVAVSPNCRVSTLMNIQE
jgi:hypothetical protein